MMLESRFQEKGGINLKNITWKEHTFEVVDEAPLGYVIWSIGENMVDGYLPFVRLGGYDGCQVDTRTMKAMKIEKAQVILAAIGNGQNTSYEMESYVEKHKYAKPGTWEHWISGRMKKAIPIMKSINL
jgi:hypothetical protein